MKKNRTEITVDGVALDNKQTNAITGLATIGYYTVMVGSYYVGYKLASKVVSMIETRNYNKFLKKEAERKAKDAAKA